MSIFGIFKKKRNVCPWCGHANNLSATYCVRCRQAMPVFPAATKQPYTRSPQSNVLQPDIGNAVSSPIPRHASSQQPYAPPPSVSAVASSSKQSRSSVRPSVAGGFTTEHDNVPKAVYVSDAASGVAGSEYADGDWDGETTVLDAMDDDDETTILEGTYMPNAYLVREDMGERINISGEQFVLGRSRESANYCVEDRPVISRSHATIVFNDGRYFIVDMNSSNRTYLDDVELVPGQSAELFSGTRIRLADLDFTFYIA